MSQRDKPRQGVVAITLDLFRGGDVGFIDWLDVYFAKRTGANLYSGMLILP